MTNALSDFAALSRATPQTMRTPGRTDEVKNNAEGYTFKASDQTRLERFLVLGTDGGSYYVGERQLTVANAQFVIDMIKANEAAVLDTVVAVSEAGRAPKNSQAIFTLALVLTHGTDKAAVREAFPKVVRTATHLFEFVNYINTMSGWGRAKRSLVASWYTDKPVDSVAFQMVKYRSRTV